MDKKVISELDNLKLIYFEIIDGYSPCSDLNCYIKHFSEKESHLLLQKKIELQKYYSESGVPLEEELLKQRIESGDWSKEKEEQILQLKVDITDAENGLHTILPEQRGFLQNILEEKQKALSELRFERKNVLGRCVEDLVDEDVNDYVSYLSCYKDPALAEHIKKSYQEFQELEQEETNKIAVILSENYKRFSEENLKFCSVMPFFLNKFSYCKEDIQSFLGIPVNQLTHNQNYLFSMGVRNLNVLQKAEGSPPDLNLDATPLAISKWYDIQYSIQLGKSKQKS